MPKTRRRGVTLTEAVLFIAIALGLIVAGLVLFQQASLASRMSAQTRLLSALVSETRGIFQQQSNFRIVTTAPLDIAPVLVAAGAVPPATSAAIRSAHNPPSSMPGEMTSSCGYVSKTVRSESTSPY